MSGFGVFSNFARKKKVYSILSCDKVMCLYSDVGGGVLKTMFISFKQFSSSGQLFVWVMKVNINIHKIKHDNIQSNNINNYLPSIHIQEHSHL